jgi:ATP synthase protein I
MGDDRKRAAPDSLGELDRRLKQARKADHRGDQQSENRGSALGFGFKIAVDLVCAVAVGFGLGYFLDWWLGTSPLFLLIMLPLGMAAGILNVMRAAKIEEARRQAEDRSEHDATGS